MQQLTLAELRRYIRDRRPQALVNQVGVCLETLYRVAADSKDVRVSTLQRIADGLGIEIVIQPRK